MKANVISGLKLALVPLLLAACSQSTGPRTTREAATVPAAAAHAVQADELRAIMASLSRHATVSWPQELEDDYRRASTTRIEVSLRRAAELAAGLSDTADAIPAALEGASISEADRREFLSRAGSLKAHADALRAEAVARDIDAMRATLGLIRNTCTSCHTRFRDVAGPLG